VNFTEWRNEKSFVSRRYYRNVNDTKSGKPLSQIVIDHPTVSAQHAVLLRTGASYSLKDLNSTNGTQINGDFVTDAELKDGDTIRFGSVAAVFAGAYRNPCSGRGIRNFWTRISR
jgi:pSer/pThr/pTyr-binding forkhead associated (FHA) protein